MRTPEHIDQLIVADGFSSKNRAHARLEELAQALGERISIGRVDIIDTCPAALGNQTPDTLVDRLERKVDGLLVRSKILGGGDRRVIVGFSYGGDLVLNLLAVRKKIEEFCRAFLINSPLNPRVSVLPPENGMFAAFQAQYDAREEFMRRCVEALLRIPQRKRIVTMGTSDDNIVPAGAKMLPGLDHYPILDCSGHVLSPELIRAAVRRMVSDLSRQETQVKVSAHG